MVTSLEYAELAARIYEIDTGATNRINFEDFEYPRHFEEGMGWGEFNTDFKGGIYIGKRTRAGHVVIAFQGTVPSKGGDLLADVKIGTLLVPNYCGAAFRLVRRTLDVYPNSTISLVGHSLGGAIAQVIGHWTGFPFCTFNAPGMWLHIQNSKVLLAFYSDLKRSWRGTFNSSLTAKHEATTGRNFRNVLDPVSLYGSHYGPVTRFWGGGVHSMDDIRERIRNSHWAHKVPYDPANKEWGEL